MIDRFADRIDSRSDRCHPIVVRELRRFSRQGGLHALALAAPCLQAAGVCFFLFHKRFVPGYYIEIPLALLAGFVFIVTMLIALGGMCWDRSRWGGSSSEPPAMQDEMFRLTALGPKDWAHAFTILSLILGIYVGSLFFPFLLASQLLGAFHFWPFAILWVWPLTLFTILFNNLSYEGLVRSRGGSDLLSIFTFFLGGAVLVVPWVCLFRYGFRELSWPMMEWDRGPIALFLWFGLPMTSLSILFISYHLLLFHFKNGARARFRMILFNYFTTAAANLGGVLLFGLLCLLLW